jgi:peptidoglycan hydrolase-like protein with peptidoglycan-binding domain
VQSILSLLASFNADQLVIDAVNASLHGHATPGSSPSTSSSSFARNVGLGMTDDEVQALQVFLNTHGFPVSPSGRPGSPGNEGTFFGNKTHDALAKFQQAHNLPATGYLGPLTRGVIAGM